MIGRRAFESLSGAELGWLTAKHHFAVDVPDSGWGALRIWNDDEIAPGSGFPLHFHKNMEIITYVREGALSHQDSLGGQDRISAGDIQIISAGTGIRHAEYNHEKQTTRIFQIWIEPSVDGGVPRWGAKPFPKSDRAGRWVTLASGFESDREALKIRAEARVLAATLNLGQTVTYDIEKERFLYLVPATGSADINGVRVEARDGMVITDEPSLTVTALRNCEILLVDAPPKRPGL